MALIKQYQSFKANLLGYAEIGISEYRDKIMPLGPKKTWTADEEEYVRSLVDAGAGYALQQLLTQGHPALAKVVGAGLLTPDPMPKAELVGHIQALLKSCKTGRWTQNNYINFSTYLNSNMTPEQLREGGDNNNNTTYQRPGGNTDNFAAAFREASPAYKRYVMEQLSMAAADAADEEAAVAAAAAAATAN